MGKVIGSFWAASAKVSEEGCKHMLPDHAGSKHEQSFLLPRRSAILEELSVNKGEECKKGKLAWSSIPFSVNKDKL